MLVYVLALGAAALFGVGSVVQQRVAALSPPGSALRLRLLWWLVRQPLWLVGVGTAIVGNVLSGTALGLGSVALVQPLLVTRLLFALPLAALWARQRVPRRDLGGALATAAGLGIFIAAGQPVPGQRTDPAIWKWGLAGGLIVGITVGLVVLARRLRVDREAPILGAGAGMLFGLQAGLTHTAVSGFADGGLLAVLTNGATYGVVATALGGTLLAQSAYSMAPLTASYPTLAAVEPLAGIGVGVGVLGGALLVSPTALAAEVGGLAVMTFGIYLLARSPLVTGQLDLLERRAEEDLAYRTEEEIARDLERLRADLERAEREGVYDPSRPDRRVLADLERLDRDVDRLCDLEADITSHQSRGEAHRVDAAERTPEQQAEYEEHERRLDAWAQEIRERAERLRAMADELRAEARGEPVEAARG